MAGLKLDFLRPARFNDHLSTDVALLKLGLASLTLAQSITREAITREAGGDVLEGTVRIACLDALSLRPKPLSPPLQSALRDGT